MKNGCLCYNDSSSIAPMPFPRNACRTKTSFQKAWVTRAFDDQLPIPLLIRDPRVAGVDTPSITLAYVLWEVSRRPDIQQRLHAELDGAMPNSRAIPDISILHKLPFLTAVVKEGLSLYFPPYALSLTNFDSPTSLRCCAQPFGTCRTSIYQHDK